MHDISLGLFINKYRSRKKGANNCIRFYYSASMLTIKKARDCLEKFVNSLGQAADSRFRRKGVVALNYKTDSNTVCIRAV